MKRLIIYTLISLIAWTANAQSFQPTWGNPCVGCLPPGYELISGSPAISNPSGVGGSAQTPWQGLVPNPPAFTNGDQEHLSPGEKKSFLTLRHVNLVNKNQQDLAKVTVEKFVVGKSYNFRFSNLFSRTAASNSAQSVTIKITTGGKFPALLKTVTINNIGENYWANNLVTFTPTESILNFTFSAQAASGTSGYVNLDISQYAFDCVIPPAQVQLFHSNDTDRYQCGRTGLDKFAQNVLPPYEPVVGPPNGVLIWKKVSSSSGEDLKSSVVSAAPVGVYYAFYKDMTMPSCYNVQTSTAKAVITYVPEQVPLTKTTVSNECPQNTANLASAFFYSDAEEEVRYFSNNVHQGAHVQDPFNVTTPGDYYAFWYNKKYNCYSTDLSTSKVTVTIKSCCAAGTAQVALSRSNTGNTCPATTVNLNNTKVTNQPPFTSVVWFKDASHTVPVQDPTQAGTGIYYAFFKDNATGCFNTDMSTTTLTVTINACASKVDLGLKVFLQGATVQSGGITSMRTNLQDYFGAGAGLLPGVDPYGSGAVNNDINNKQFSGQVVDWVKVEIRSADDPAIIFESQSLWLRPNGTVVNLLGQNPKFNPQPEAVQIVVKHRNHLAVLSNPIALFTAGMVNYDFTTDLSKAYNVGAPPQMVLRNGVWCMWAGDVNNSQDLGIDATDYNNTFLTNSSAPFDVYNKTDLNMDGGVDATDLNMMFINNAVAPFSTLINY